MVIEHCREHQWHHWVYDFYVEAQVCEAIIRQVTDQWDGSTGNDPCSVLRFHMIEYQRLSFGVHMSYVASMDTHIYTYIINKYKIKK